MYRVSVQPAIIIPIDLFFVFCLGYVESTRVEMYAHVLKTSTFITEYHNWRSGSGMIIPLIRSETMDVAPVDSTSILGPGFSSKALLES
jgi:hypothetical protein